MPKAKKKRDHVEMDGKASSVRRNDVQLAAASRNAGNWPEFKPWEASKAKRLAKRIRSGKTYKNWAKANAKKEPIANVSNLSTNGS